MLSRPRLCLHLYFAAVSYGSPAHVPCKVALKLLLNSNPPRLKSLRALCAAAPHKADITRPIALVMPIETTHFKSAMHNAWGGVLRARI